MAWGFSSSSSDSFESKSLDWIKLAVYLVASVGLMIADSQLRVLEPLRDGVSTVIHPVIQVLRSPVNWVQNGGNYFQALNEAIAKEKEAELLMTRQAHRLNQISILEQENTQLRELLDLKPKMPAQTQAAEVLYDMPDPYTHKMVISIGRNHQVLSGSPVVDARGVLGQVTKVFATTAEVTLLNDKDAAIAVFNPRTQSRSVAYGDPADSGMELRYVSTNADVKAGDLLITSGLDGIFPSGLPVATISQVERQGTDSFAHISLKPTALPHLLHHVLEIGRAHV